MKLSLSSSPHLRRKRDTGQVMRMVIYAMVPGIAAQCYVFGWGVLIQACLAVAAPSDVALAIVLPRPDVLARGVQRIAVVLGVAADIDLRRAERAVVGLALPCAVVDHLEAITRPCIYVLVAHATVLARLAVALVHVDVAVAALC